MSTKYAILGVLMQCPAHGYKIKKIFAPFMSRDGINDGQLYPLLTRLETEKLVRKETVHQQKSPSKNLYHITERGCQEFLRWLVSPENESDPVKYDFFMQYSFLMKCNFFEHLPKRERVSKLKRQIEAAQRKIGEYERIRQDMLKRRLNAYKIKIVEFGIETQKLKIQWVNDLLACELRKGWRLSAASALPRPKSSRAAGNTEAASTRNRPKPAKRKG